MQYISACIPLFSSPIYSTTFAEHILKLEINRIRSFPVHVGFSMNAEQTSQQKWMHFLLLLVSAEPEARILHFFCNASPACVLLCVCTTVAIQLMRTFQSVFNKGAQQIVHLFDWISHNRVTLNYSW